MVMLTINPSIEDMRRYKASKLRKAKQKAHKVNSKKALEIKFKGIGSLQWATVMTGLAPYNTKRGTIWLIDAGAKVLSEKTKSGYRIWLTKGIIYKTMSEVRNSCKHYIARKEELKFLNEEVKISK